jgi:hypothetical protein
LELTLGSGNKPSPLALLLLLLLLPLAAAAASPGRIMRGTDTHIMLLACAAVGEDDMGRFLPRTLPCGVVRVFVAAGDGERRENDAD